MILAAALRALAGPGSGTLQLSLAGVQGTFIAGARALMQAWQQDRSIVHHSQAFGACKHKWFFLIKSLSPPVCYLQIGRCLLLCGMAATTLHCLSGPLLDSLQYVHISFVLGCPQSCIQRLKRASLCNSAAPHPSSCTSLQHKVPLCL